MSRRRSSASPTSRRTPIASAGCSCTAAARWSRSRSSSSSWSCSASAEASPSVGEVREKVRAAGGTLQVVDARPGDHTLQPDQKGDWNTDPPTSGEHFGFDNNQQLGTTIWGAWEEPLQMARVVHNLEHGGIFIFYGSKVKHRSSRSSASSTTATRTGLSSRRTRSSETRSRSAPGTPTTRGTRRRTSRGSGSSTRTRSPPSSAPSSSRAPSVSRRSRSSPAAASASSYTASAGVAERVRRARLKSGCPQWGRAGSSPAPGT